MHSNRIVRPAGARRILVAVASALALTATACGGGESSSGGGASGPAVTAGRNVAQQTGCMACHSTDGSTGVGPSFKGLAGRQVTFVDGSTTTADDAYIRQAITDPNARVVRGFTAGLMPATYGDSLSNEQIDQLVAYMNSLK